MKEIIDGTSVLKFYIKHFKKNLPECTFLAPYKKANGEIRVQAHFKNGNVIAITVGDVNALTNADYDRMFEILTENSYAKSDI